MKAYVRPRQIDIGREVKKMSYRCDDIDELYFYRNVYNAIEKLSSLYEDGYDAIKVYKDITTDMSVSDSVQEVIELNALETSILALLVGLNRESLQEANSSTKDRSLFQYLNYQSEVQVPIGPYKKVSGYEYSKRLAESLKFNPSKTGPFPYMLSISKTDSKNRPYDYVSKIRNALQHAEYFQKNGDINTIHITNHNDQGELTFEGDLLLWPYKNFVEDFYGLGLGVSNDFELYDIPGQKLVKNRDDLINFLKDFNCTKIKFMKIPDKYKFSGQNGLFSKLNKCFGLDSRQTKDVMKILSDMQEEGLEFEFCEMNLSDENINCIIEYLESAYPNDVLYNNEEFIKHVSPVVKLVYYPNHDLTNSLSNILRYIDMKKLYLALGEKPNLALFNEQYYDQELKLSFKYALMLIKANLVSYCMECDKFEKPDLRGIDLEGVKVYPQSEYQLRMSEDYNTSSPNQNVVINCIRNAIAHGNKRLDIKTGANKEIVFSDLYDPKHELHISGGLDDFEKMLSNSCFRPENIVIKETNKTKVKTIGKYN